VKKAKNFEAPQEILSFNIHTIWMFGAPDPGDCERFPLKTDLRYAQVPWRHALM